MKVTCQSSTHPFKQKTYNYDPGYSSDTSSPKYCMSCMFIRNTAKVMVYAIATPRQSLYGNKTIRLDEATVLGIVKDVYKEIGELEPQWNS